MRAVKMAAGLVLMLLSIVSLIVLLVVNGPHPFLYSGAGFAVGLGIFLYYRHRR